MTTKSPAADADDAQNASSTPFTAEERAAMKERAKEVKRSRSRGASTTADGAADVLEKIAEMHGDEREFAERLHAAITANIPELTPKTWYGMPGYAKDGKVVVFFQSAEKFKTRYATLGFNETARLDEGEMWPVAYALETLSDAVLARAVELVRRAAG